MQVQKSSIGVPAPNLLLFCCAVKGMQYELNFKKLQRINPKKSHICREKAKKVSREQLNKSCKIRNVLHFFNSADALEL